jgi:hypothetical protein
MSQAVGMYDQLKAKGLVTALVLFEGEQHGFRGTSAIRCVCFLHDDWQYSNAKFSLSFFELYEAGWVCKQCRCFICDQFVVKILARFYWHDSNAQLISMLLQASFGWRVVLFCKGFGI